MGEEPWRVHRAGAPSLDHLSRSNCSIAASLEERLGVQFTSPSLIAAWHPVTILRDTNAEADALFAALAQHRGQILFVYPNADAGSHALIERTRALAETRAETCIFVNLDAVTYWSLLGQVDGMVGNSSSGIMEAASFALPVVNVGMRQQGRERAANIIDAPADTKRDLRGFDSGTGPRISGGTAWDGQSLRGRHGRCQDCQCACNCPAGGFADQGTRVRFPAVRSSHDDSDSAFRT
jgi:UDP-hydrolysing UDP-N-acetyl-D-glucosamine 2-epimerase